MINYLAKRCCYLIIGLILYASVAQAVAAEAWYYHEKLASLADSRAVLKPEQHPSLDKQTLADQPIFQLWVWRMPPKQTNLVKIQRSYSASKSKQGRARALPFWLDLQPKDY